MYNFYAVIIGTEILNGRREDAHFAFVKNLLAKHGWTLFASLTIKDDPELITKTYEMILADEKAVMFSFGGIGSTPDDLTRHISANVFTSQPVQRHPQFEHDVIERFKEDAYPYRILMSDVPVGSKLLKNPVNNMSGYYLQDRYFFVPGFPEMAHPMITQAVEQYYDKAPTTYRKTLEAFCSEDRLNYLMHKLPKNVELSSLPQFVEGKPFVTLSLCGYHQADVEKWFTVFADYLAQIKIPFTIT